MIDFNNLPAQNKIYYQDDAAVIYCADNREILPLFPDKAFSMGTGCAKCNRKIKIEVGVINGIRNNING